MAFNIKLQAAEALGIHIIRRDWIDWLIVHVGMEWSFHE